MNPITQSPGWNPVTLHDQPEKDMSIPYVFTAAERDHNLICELERRAMQAHRDPPGLVVTDVTESEWLDAVEARRGR